MGEGLVRAVEDVDRADVGGEGGPVDVGGCVVEFVGDDSDAESSAVEADDDRFVAVEDLPRSIDELGDVGLTDTLGVLEPDW